MKKRGVIFLSIEIMKMNVFFKEKWMLTILHKEVNRCKTNKM